MEKEEMCFYSVNDFAKLLSTSPACVRKLIRNGQIKSLKLNSAKRAKHRIPINELYRLNSSVYGEENE